MAKKIIAGVVVAGAIALAPMAAKSVIDTTIETQKTNLEKNGINLNILNNTGYFSSNREFELRIENVEKFKDFLSSLAVNKDMAYDKIFSKLKKRDIEKFDKFVKGMVFKGNISNSNINPSSDIEAYTYLHKFSDETMTYLEKDETGKKYILPFLKEEGIAFTTVLSNEGKIKTVSLKDINETLEKTKKSGKTETMDFKVLGHKYVNKSTDTNIIGNMNLDKMAFAFNGRNDVKMSFNKLAYDFDYLNELISKGSMTLGSVEIIAKKGEKAVLKDTKVTSDGYLKDNKYFANVTFENNGFELISRKSDLSLKKVNFDFAISNANYEALTKLNKSYMAFESASLDVQGMSRIERKKHLANISQPLIDSLGEVVNSGLDLDINLDLQKLLFKKLNLEDAKVNVMATLKKNDLNIKTFNKLFLLGVIDADINIEMTENDLKHIINTANPKIAPMIMMYAKIENKKATFHLNLKDGKIQVNGKKVN